jgi:hypothetical protein
LLAFSLSLLYPFHENLQGFYYLASEKVKTSLIPIPSNS